MAELSTAAVVDVRLVLPDHWWVIPLRPPGVRTRSVERLVERQFAGVDDQPLLRADTCRQLLAQAETAADSDGRLMALSLRRVHERPAELTGAEPTPSLVADYWLERPDGAGLVQLAFATPMLPLLELFDAVAGALRWVTADEPHAPTLDGQPPA